MRHNYFLSILIASVLFGDAFAGATSAKRIYPTMKHIKGNTFQMGCTNGKADEAPVHTVTVSSFYMDSTEVTQKEFIALMEKYYSPFKLFGLLETVVKGDNYPKNNISWHDMVLYCNARSKGETFDTVYAYDSLSDTVGLNGSLYGVKIDYKKVGYRLPTEAEWEYACRAGAATDYYWVDNSAPDSFAWFDENSERMVHPVALKLPNAFGLYDICGNVFEFCNDWYAPYDSGQQVDPHGPDTGSLKIGRGGSMMYRLTDMRICRRLEFMPNIRYLYYGFRVVLPDTDHTGVKTSHIEQQTFRPLHNQRVFFKNQANSLSFSKEAAFLIVYTLDGRQVFKINNNRSVFRPVLHTIGNGAFIVQEYGNR